MNISSPTPAKNPFWDFSLEFYGREGVAEAFLSLQDEIGADVNILLYCCWIAAEGAGEIEPAELAEIIAVIEPWQIGVVQSLRQIRRDMKHMEAISLGELSEQLRQAIKNCELEGEQIEQWVLYQSGQNAFPASSLSPQVRAQNAESNLNNYIRMVYGDLSEKDQKLIQFIGQESAAAVSS
ncbi:MAG: TIGR02444 family protein [Rhodospirillaceae bacterium]|jgi:uncharacterized protein (TIGR02444 family)|nr:TIGR02444 family protein [Rhodospirillaceae bacterium]MBT4937815.1 TIGR02444 family protein [Rhodospirillaceae bacterium]MBT5940349.1 TIGR02444 family protein [Rhodospirillaceae bacterium]MBT7267532.1 TIGR02444 family protein [Rhodospirillaceae bacterium]